MEEHEKRRVKFEIIIAMFADDPILQKQVKTVLT